MGHPTLRQIAQPYPVDDIGSPAFLELVEDMRETLHAYGGIGLAAPQIDVPFRIAVIEIVNTSSRYGEIPAAPFAVYVNPEINVVKEDAAGYWEGCLSVPGIMGYVERPQHITVGYLDARGEKQSLEAEGFLATVFQHEFDHLNGHLFVDHITDMSKLAYDEEYRNYHAGTSPEA
jgi:peptide deformylase